MVGKICAGVLIYKQIESIPSIIEKSVEETVMKKFEFNISAASVHHSTQYKRSYNYLSVPHSFQVSQNQPKWKLFKDEVAVKFFKIHRDPISSNNTTSPNSTARSSTARALKNPEVEGDQQTKIEKTI
eukprot:TRINITY_DN13915_c0_g1_i1.p1 TRINITY_DN13915_c0_g1~~TRINITY_DN13915_c0_g1_i1.p1  ORF type:complete len:128 (-),score=27.82 TRINITY_DN13915_c0_g1_i1:4-387(-)